MKLSGKVVKKVEESYKNKTTGLDVITHRIYLQSGDVLAGALEVKVNEDDYAKINEGESVSFIPSFGMRKNFDSLIVTVKSIGNLEVVE